MRTIPSGLAAALQQQQLTLAICTKVVRSDNVTLGFTDLDRDILFGGVTYEANSAQDASTVNASLGTEGTNLDVVGLLTSDSITDTDLLAGRYDGATVEIFVVNYEQQPSITERVVLFSGSIDECTFGTGHYTVTLRSLMQRLSLNIGELTSQTCLARFGDARCKFPVATVTYSRTLSAVTSPLILRFGADAIQTGYYDGGKVTFTSGANAGLSMEIKSHTHDANTNEAVINLQLAFPFAAVVGDAATLQEGCKLTLADCQRHANIINRRAFDFLPGSDRILRVGKR